MSYYVCFSSKKWYCIEDVQIFELENKHVFCRLKPLLKLSLESKFGKTKVQQGCLILALFFPKASCSYSSTLSCRDVQMSRSQSVVLMITLSPRVFIPLQHFPAVLWASLCTTAPFDFCAVCLCMSISCSFELILSYGLESWIISADFSADTGLCCEV